MLQPHVIFLKEEICYSKAIYGDITSVTGGEFTITNATLLYPRFADHQFAFELNVRNAGTLEVPASNIAGYTKEESTINKVRELLKS
jgi:hypothetical protein